MKRQFVISVTAVMMTFAAFNENEYLYTHRAVAAPSPIGEEASGGQAGGGGNCPPGCPVTPANCDAALQIVPAQSLQFGAIAVTTGGTVTVDTTGVRSPFGGVVLMTGGTVAAASFDMNTGNYNCNGTALPVITAGPTTQIDHTTVAGATMTVDTFTTNPAAGGAFSDTTPLTVGATLHVNSGQEPGDYAGFYDLTVTFQ